MALPLIPILIMMLGGGAVVGAKKHIDKKKLTPQRKMIYETAMKSVKEPEKLRELASAFREVGLNNHASMLEKRAKLRALPPDVKAARKAAFQTAMTSTDPKKVIELANAFEKEGATGASEALREYAKTLQQTGRAA